MRDCNLIGSDANAATALNSGGWFPTRLTTVRAGKSDGIYPGEGNAASEDQFAKGAPSKPGPGSGVFRKRIADRMNMCTSRASTGTDSVAAETTSQYDKSLRSRKLDTACPSVATRTNVARSSGVSTGLRSIEGDDTLESFFSDKAVQANLCSVVLLEPLLTGVKAHDSSLTDGILVAEPWMDSMLFVSASMDKTVAAWRIKMAPEGSASPQPYVEVQKIMAAGGPLFSLVRAPEDSSVVNRDNQGKPIPHPILLYCGNAAKEVVALQPFKNDFEQMKLGEHEGWVRSLAVGGKFLYSSGNNVLHQWDTTFAVPKEVAQVKLDHGDILAMAADKKRVFTAGADGAVRSWRVADKNNGQLVEGTAVLDAHEGRACTLVLHGDYLFSSGCDGIIKAWDKRTMELQGEVVDAHGGEKVQCMVAAPGGLLFTGGDDHAIRAWDISSLADSETLLPANYCLMDPHHSASVRMLVAGQAIRAWVISSLADSKTLLPANYCLMDPHYSASVRMLVAGQDCLVSGDSDGIISFWNYGPAVAGFVDAEAATAEAERIALVESMEESNQLFNSLYDASANSM
eukprot:gene20608-27408_t